MAFNDINKRLAVGIYTVVPFQKEKYTSFSNLAWRARLESRFEICVFKKILISSFTSNIFVLFVVGAVIRLCISHKGMGLFFKIPVVSTLRSGIEDNIH